MRRVDEEDEEEKRRRKRGNNKPLLRDAMPCQGKMKEGRRNTKRALMVRAKRESERLAVQL